MGPESKLWNKIRKASSDIYIERVENLVSTGMPDTHWCRGLYDSGWCELKVTNWPKRGERKLNLKEFRFNQRLWAREYIKAGGQYYLAVGFHGREEVVWFPGEVALIADTLPAAEWERYLGNGKFPMGAQ